MISAKTGENIHAVLERIVSDIPAPSGEAESPLRALIFAFPFDLHIIENLCFHIPLGDRLGLLKNPVCQRALPMVDVPIRHRLSGSFAGLPR